MSYLSKLNLDGTDKNLKDEEAFSTRDSAETAIANDDMFPFYDSSATAKKNTTFSNLFSKLRTSLGAMTAAQLKTGTNTTIKGMRADYANNGIRQIISEAVSNDTIETIGSNSSKKYSIGEYFLANDGYYYVAISDITTSTVISNSVASKTSISVELKRLRDDLTILQTAIVPIETSSSASRYYYANQQFIYQGEIYRVKDAEIAPGDTIQPGTNCILAGYLVESLSKYAYFSDKNTYHMAVKHADKMFGWIIANASSIIYVNIITSNVTSSMSSSGYTVTYLYGSSAGTRLLVDGAATDGSGGETVRLKVRQNGNATFNCYAFFLAERATWIGYA